MASKRILLVEDQALIAMQQEIALREEGFETVTAMDAAEAIRITREMGDSIDLILMDIDLGLGMDGTRAAEIILSERDIPIVFLSSHGETGMVERTRRITNYGYILKTAGEMVLFASIDMAFKLHDALIKARESEKRYRELYESSYNGIVMLDSDRRIVDCNSAFLGMLGYAAPKDIIGRFFRSFLTASFREGDMEFIGRDHEIELESCRGDIVYASVNSHESHDVDGKAVGTWLIVQDITESTLTKIALLDSVEQLLSIMRASMDGFWINDAEGRILSVNEAYCKMICYDETELIGSSIHKIEASGSEATFERLKKAKESGSTRFASRHKRKDGSLIEVELSAVYIRDKDRYLAFISGPSEGAAL